MEGVNVRLPASLEIVVLPLAWVSVLVRVLSPLRLPKVLVDSAVMVKVSLTVMSPLSVKVPLPMVVPEVLAPKALAWLITREPLPLTVVVPV